jgi:hypothetical protein
MRGIPPLPLAADDTAMFEKPLVAATRLEYESTILPSPDACRRCLPWGDDDDADDDDGSPAA